MGQDSDTRGERRHLIAPAKLNIRLKIVGRRSNGFHELSMLNVLISLYDEIELEYQTQPGVRLLNSPTALGDEKANIAARAAQRFIERFSLGIGVELSLKKSIPVGAGLGGGSSDAAAVLRCMSQDFARDVDRGGGQRALLDLALSLGADVPYFIGGTVAAVSGVGEVLREIAILGLLGTPILLCSPSQPLSTDLMYKEYRLRFPQLSSSQDGKLDSFVKSQRSPLAVAESYSILLSLVENDFEQLLESISPPVWQSLCVARAHPSFVCGLTGSGSSFFALPRQVDSLPIELENEFRLSLEPLGVSVRRVSLI